MGHCEKFLSLWKDADPGIAEVEEIENEIQELRAQEDEYLNEGIETLEYAHTFKSLYLAKYSAKKDLKKGSKRPGGSKPSEKTHHVKRHVSNHSNGQALSQKTWKIRENWKLSKYGNLLE